MNDFIDYVGAIHDRLTEHGLAARDQQRAVRRAAKVAFVTAEFRHGTDPVEVADRIHNHWLVTLYERRVYDLIASGVTVRDATEILGKSVNSVRSTLYRARKGLTNERGD